MALENIIQAIPDVLLYIVPGFLTEKIVETFTPTRQRSEYETTLWSLLYSFLVKISVDIFQACFKIAIEIFHPNCTAEIYFSNFESWRIAVYIVVAIIVGMLIVRVTKSKAGTNIAQLFNSNFCPTESVWLRLMEECDGRWATVITKDGFKYIGVIKNYTLDPDDSTKEIALISYKYFIKKTPDSDIYDFSDTPVIDYTTKIDAKVLLKYEDILSIHLNPAP